MRVVHGLRWARIMEGELPFHTSSRARGVKGEGLRYEKALAKGLGAKFRHGLWWEYKDAGGIGYCQTDFLGKAKEWVIILESKLTWTQEAEEQLWELYVPVVASALQLPQHKVLPIVVCKYLTQEAASRPTAANLKESIREAMEMGPPCCSVWHHIGGVPLLMDTQLSYA